MIIKEGRIWNTKLCIHESNRRTMFIARTFLGFKKRFLLIYVAQHRHHIHLRSWRNCVIQNLLSHITCECVKVSWVQTTNAMRINVTVKHYSVPPHTFLLRVPSYEIMLNHVTFLIFERLSLVSIEIDLNEDKTQERWWKISSNYTKF